MQEAILLREVRLDRQGDLDATGRDVCELGSERCHRALAGEARANARDGGFVKRRRHSRIIRNRRFGRIPCASMHLVLLCIGLRAVEDGMHIDKDLVAASATPLVLAILAERESYGYAILKQVRALSGGELEWTDGMLYPLLHRLRRLGYVTTEWRMPPEGRRRQYYMITDDGRTALAEQHRQWVAVTRALNDVWPGSGVLLTTALGEG
jgi:DNA-binding PadR family transcriptional regulator